jgi:hypothetical protein
MRYDDGSIHHTDQVAGAARVMWFDAHAGRFAAEKNLAPSGIHGATETS